MSGGTNMLNQFSRTQLLLGSDNMDRLADAKVAVFGIGGVGGYVVDAVSYTHLTLPTIRLV